MKHGSQHLNGRRVTPDRLSRCPSCLRPVAVYDDWVDVNGSFVHAACARLGEYEETPSPGWTEAEELARGQRRQ